MSTGATGHGGRHRPWRGVALMMAVALGLLLWARLKLVTDTPRMVYADPKAKAVEGAGGPSGPAGGSFGDPAPGNDR